jgi:hypothetical protein
MFFMSSLRGKFFIFFIFFVFGLKLTHGAITRAKANRKAEAEILLPFGTYTPLNAIQRNLKNNETLRDEVNDLTLLVRDTVKDIAAHRNTQCFGDPCLFQIFPIVYNIPDSGFYGGARAKLTNVSRVNPALYSLETYIIRSDTQQWLTYLALDAPQISWLPLNPRLKARTFYSRVTERRYFGTGSTFEETFDPDDRFRYSLEEIGFQSSFILPLFKLGQQKVNIFASYSTVKHSPKMYPSESGSKLFTDAPRGVDGGKSNRIGLGLQLDSRDQEVLSRRGWSLEVSGEISRQPLSDFNFNRYSLIDRRYFSKGSFTFANRFTFDILQGSPPFWELEGVGGIDPIGDITNSTLFRGLRPGRFHESIKIVENMELRWYLNPTRILGLHTEPVWMIAAVDAGRFGNINDVSLSSGFKFLVNRNVQIQTYVSYSRFGTNVYADFGQEF